MSSVLICLCAFVGWRFLNYLSFVDCQTVAEEDYNELGEEGNYHHCYCHYVLVHAWLTNTWQIGRSIQSEE
jgi:hypothetical protein